MLILAFAFAHEDGETGRSTSGCKDCHGKTAASSTTVSIDASDIEVAPGETIDIIVTVATTTSSRTHGGLNVSTSGGTLAAGSNTQLDKSEITHLEPEAMSSGEVDFEFTWTAPSTEKTYLLHAAGNAVDGDGRSNGDGWNLAADVTITVDDGCDDFDGDGWTNCDDDCDEANASINPGEDETCNDIDDDCDGETDESSAIDADTWYPDADGDGWGDSTSWVASCTQPAGYVATSGDCDDADAAVAPGAVETCDGEDQDCDGTADDDAVDRSTYYADLDGDGFGDATSTELSCDVPAGYTTDTTDCDDSSASVSPEGVEACNDLDDDCDAAIDEDAVDVSSFYEDADGDGWGSSVSADACDAPSGFVAVSGDCDDTSALFSPSAVESDCADPTDYNCDGLSGAYDNDGDGYFACEECDDGDADVSPVGIEVCDGVDNDCDGTADAAAIDAVEWYTDGDGDGFGDAAVFACTRPSDAVAISGDCDDGDAARSPGETEVCNAVDDDCDGDVDGGAADVATWYGDSDDDGYGDEELLACTLPDGAVAIGGDCAPSDAAVHPGAEELCNSLDDDCDGTTDVGAVDAATWYADADGDGFGDAAVARLACEAPAGTVENADDCDDADADRAADCGGDTGGEDTGAVDTGVDDTGVDDTGVDDTGGGDTGEVVDTAVPEDTGQPVACDDPWCGERRDTGCSCSSGTSGIGIWLLGALALVRRFSPTATPSAAPAAAPARSAPTPRRRGNLDR